MTQRRDHRGRFVPDFQETQQESVYLHQQVSRLDREMATLAASQAIMSEQMGKMADSISTLSHEMREGFESVAKYNVSSSKTNWQTLTSIASVFLLIIGGLYGIVSSNASDGRLKNAQAIQKLDEEFVHQSQQFYMHLVDNARSDATQNERLDHIQKDLIQKLETDVKDRFTKTDYRDLIVPEIRRLTSEFTNLQERISAAEASIGGRKP